MWPFDLPKCQGDWPNFSAGYGGCDTYSVTLVGPNVNHKHCSFDKDQNSNLSASLVCPECGKCSLLGYATFTTTSTSQSPTTIMCPEVCTECEWASDELVKLSFEWIDYDAVDLVELEYVSACPPCFNLLRSVCVCTECLLRRRLNAPMFC